MTALASTILGLVLAQPQVSAPSAALPFVATPLVATPLVATALVAMPPAATSAPAGEVQHYGFGFLPGSIQQVVFAGQPLLTVQVSPGGVFTFTTAATGWFTIAPDQTTTCTMQARGRRRP